jgi:hypothetical protein
MTAALDRSLLCLILVLAFCASCAHLPQYAVAGPSPTPEISPSPSPTGSAACAGPAANTTAFIVISVTVLPSTSPVYGAVNGYIEANSDGTFGLTAQVVTLHASDVVQFVNVDDYGGALSIYHSAVGFPKASGFPVIPYPFLGSAAQPLGSALSSSTQWSTGRLGIPSAICYSQTFSLSAGTYYFGDYDFYNSLNSIRGVINVQAGNNAMRRAVSPIILGH